MKKALMLMLAVLGLALTCLGQSAPTNQPSSPHIKPPTATAAPAPPPPPPFGAAEAAHIAREREVWDAIKKRDMKRFASYLSEDQLYVSDGGVRSKTETLKALEAAGTAPESKLDDWKVMMIDKDVAIVTYRATAIPPACGPETAAPVTRNTTIWAKRGGKWLAVFHQDTATVVGK